MSVISVCVPYWNRQNALDKMFEQYARIYPDLEIEFSVCDDGSTPPAVVPSGVRLIRLPQKDTDKNPCAPINRAVENSTGDIIVLTNPEMEHREPLLPEMLAMMEHEDDYITACCWDVDRGHWIAGPDVDYTTMGRLPVPDGAHYHFLAMFTRRLWDRAGGFDEDYRNGTGADDADWVWRAHRVGARFKTAGTVYHYKGKSHWTQPSNIGLFRSKWPNA